MKFLKNIFNCGIVLVTVPAIALPMTASGISSVTSLEARGQNFGMMLTVKGESARLLYDKLPELRGGGHGGSGVLCSLGADRTGGNEFTCYFDIGDDGSVTGPAIRSTGYIAQ